MNLTVSFIEFLRGGEVNHISREKVFIVPASTIRGLMQRIKRSGLVVTRPVRIIKKRHVTVFVSKERVAA